MSASRCASVRSSCSPSRGRPGFATRDGVGSAPAVPTSCVSRRFASPRSPTLAGCADAKAVHTSGTSTAGRPSSGTRTAGFGVIVRRCPPLPVRCVAHVPRRPTGDETSMNKTELIEIAAEDSGLARDDAAKVIDSMLTTVTDTLTSGGEVTIPGFGKFSTVQRAARTGRHPGTGAELRSKPRPHRSSPPALASRPPSTPTTTETASARVAAPTARWGGIGGGAAMRGRPCGHSESRGLARAFAPTWPSINDRSI